MPLYAPGIRDRRVRRQMLDEFADASVVLEDLLRSLSTAEVLDDDLQARHQERRLPGASEELLVIEGGVGCEDLPVGPVANGGSGHAALGPAGDLQRRSGLSRFEVVSGLRTVEGARLAAAEGQGMNLAATGDGGVETGRERVDDRGAHAVKAPDCVVASASELAPGVQLGEDDLESRQAGARFDVDGDSASVVAHLHRIIRMQGDGDGRGVAYQRLVD